MPWCNLPLKRAKPSDRSEGTGRLLEGSDKVQHSVSYFSKRFERIQNIYNKNINILHLSQHVNDFFLKNWIQIFHAERLNWYCNEKYFNSLRFVIFLPFYLSILHPTLVRIHISCWFTNPKIHKCERLHILWSSFKSPLCHNPLIFISLKFYCTFPVSPLQNQYIHFRSIPHGKKRARGHAALNNMLNQMSAINRLLNYVWDQGTVQPC